MLLDGEASMVRWPLNGEVVSSAYKRRGTFMEKVSLTELNLA